MVRLSIPVVAALLAVPLMAQKKVDCAKKPNDAQCKKSLADQNPFPGDTPSSNSSGGRQALPGADADVPGDPPSTSAPAPQRGTSSSKTPLPGADSDVPDDAPVPGKMSPNGLPEMPHDGKEPASPDDQGKSGAEKGYSSSRDGDTGPDAPAATTQDDDSPVTASPLKDLGSSGSTSAAREKLEKTRVKDDLSVGHFYSNDGNWQGAYMRYKDAADHDGESTEAQWGWAQAADKLNKKDEARSHYNAYLDLDPDGPHARAAKEALERLGQAK